MEGAIGGVIFHHSLLLHDAIPNPAADSLLRKLRHSAIPTAISHEPGISSDKMNLLKNMATLYSMDCFSLDPSSSPLDDAVNEIMLAWHHVRGTILLLLADDKKEVFHKPANCNWHIVGLTVEGASPCEGLGINKINRLEELPLTICRINRKAVGDNVVTVGYIMKPSREEDFAKRGAFPMYPTHNGLIFLPLTFDLPLTPQLQEADIVLHKATDEIVSIELGDSAEYPNKITYTTGMEELKIYMDHHVEYCVIDPLSNIYPVLDRLKIQHILLGLEDLKGASGHLIRGPHFLKVDDYKELSLIQRLSEAKLSLPCIVKPQVACGVAVAHNMAIVFKVEDFKDLKVPLPAVIQEYVNHSSILYKFYVLGEKVFYAVKKSTPNADILIKLFGSHDLKPLVFDSLKSLPTATGNPHSDSDSSKGNNNNDHIDEELVTEAARWLMRNLGLTIFGFDVVIDEDSGDHVIVDVNYLPSFKEVPDEVAIPAFWNAIKSKWESKPASMAL
ncbi:inositol 1,3,4-trisphosphate 5/6-kinase 4 isoform X2 [Humulus lupulus]|uniref:inositol 1,3,4-trisphosphate 5/6-kinase 4 isoform X2 n=1 Tax=Humulus lupulus TaxID=3486 RepID=UPI002B40144C|nr:inositol 1,3,4-trisphosphate 5/6-kinase 4 isoform X2 [Humulus lupulus]